MAHFMGLNRLAAEVDVADSGYALAEEAGSQAFKFFDGVSGVEEAALPFGV